MTGDGKITISDVWEWFLFGWFAPGDGLSFAVMKYAPALATFFEITPASYGGWISGGVSLVFWFVALFYLGSIVDKSYTPGGG